MQFKVGQTSIFLSLGEPTYVVRENVPMFLVS